MTKFGLAVVSLTLLACSAVLRSQDRVTITPRAHSSSSLLVPTSAVNLRYDVHLVQVPVLVTTARGIPVVDLRRESFRLLEDDVEFPITAFSINDAPISATVVFDSSRSMKNRILEARAGVDQFLKTASPGDDFSLVRFSDRAEILSPFTADPDVISQRLGFVEARGWTALFDAVILGAQQLHKGSNRRKVMVVFSDGGDNNSRYSESELIALLREADVEVYALSIFEKPKSLERLAEETGGRAFWIRKLEDLPDAIDRLSRQIRSEYLIGYSPGAVQNDGKYHRIRVEVSVPEGSQRLHVSWRRGYTAPGR